MCGICRAFQRYKARRQQRREQLIFSKFRVGDWVILTDPRRDGISNEWQGRRLEIIRVNQPAFVELRTEREGLNWLVGPGSIGLAEGPW